ncbi:uncharacterized protein [Antedon mediterranea]|uniref:uncharacterized protein n=1 Tax=Antedon mediterranea TaxID=105859 RepID=UPI003AF6A4D5
MASKRKQDDKHLKILREMVAKEHNKTCFDCHQRGPTYVNMKIGSFVCTSCSGILRGINPPHRVKSISMASYTPEEIEFLQNHGNEVCRQIWLGLYDSKSRAEPESKEEQKVKDFMAQKYERKRWYVEPSQAAAVASQKERERKQKEAVAKTNSFPEPKPLKSLISEPPKLVVGRQNKSSPNRKPLASIASLPTPTQTQASVEVKPSTDLLADLGGDPFGGAPAAGGNAGGFADFGSAFGGAQQPFGGGAQQPFGGGAQQPFGGGAQQPFGGGAQQPFGGGAQQPFGGGAQQPFGAPTNQQTSAGFGQPVQQNAAIAAFMQQSQGVTNNQGGFASFPPTSSAQSNVNQTNQNLQNLNISQPAGDKYAALSNLLDSNQPAEPNINWGGGGATSSSGSIDWGITGSSSSSTSLGSSKGSQPTMVGLPGPQASKFGGAAQGNNFNTAFGTPPSSNAFGAQGSASFGNQGVNAFAGQQPNAFAAQQTNAFGMPSGNTFGAPPTSNAFGAPPTSNTFGAPPTSNAFGVSQANNAFSTAQMSNFGATPANNAFGGAPNNNQFGVQKPNAFGQTAVNNPFAGVGGPTQTTASNPFLGVAPGTQMSQSNGMYGAGGAGAAPGAQQGFGQFGQPAQFGMPAQVNGSFGQVPQQNPHTMSFGTAGMTAMAANQFGKPAQATGFGQQQAFGAPQGSGVAAGAGFPSWNNNSQNTAAASNPFMGGAFMAQSAAPKPQGSSNNPFL